MRLRIKLEKKILTIYSFLNSHKNIMSLFLRGSRRVQEIVSREINLENEIPDQY